jgi:hypothetical protein
MRSRRCSGSGRPSGDTRMFGRRVTCKAPSAHVEGGSGRPEASPTAILQDTHSVEGEFLELSPEGILRTSTSAWTWASAKYNGAVGYLGMGGSWGIFEIDRR